MSKQLLDRKQMQHLHKLGLDTSNASCYVWESEGKEYLYWGKCTDKNGVPVFTLQDILDILPKCIEDKYGYEYGIEILYISDCKKWEFGYSEAIDDDIIIRQDNIIDAAYEALCLCIEKGYINTKKED